MLLVRDIMYCKPGQARAMVQKFVALSKLAKQAGFARMRVMTDVSAGRYWTVVAEMEVESLAVWEGMAERSMGMPEFQQAMDGYHDHVESGRREIFRLEE